MSTQADILNELKEVSPLLFELKQKKVLPEVPAGYFDTLPDAILSSIAASDAEIPIIFAQINRKEAAAPSGYFDSFGDTLMAKIKAEETKISGGKVVSIAPSRHHTIQLFSRFAAVASLIGIIALGVLNLKQPVPSENDCTDGIACLTQEEIYRYMNANSHEFDVELIQETVKPVLEKAETTLNMETKEATEYIDQNIEWMDVDDTTTDIF